jgi:G3E family GTPase
MSNASTFSSALPDRIRLDSITCLLDTEQLFEDLEYGGLRRLKLLQVGCADLVVLNKTELVSEELVAKTRAWIDEQLNRVRVVEAVKADIPLEVLLSVGQFERVDSTSASTGNEGPGAEHRVAFDTWSYEGSEPLDLEKIRDLVRHRLPGAVYRCTGILYSTHHPNLRWNAPSVISACTWGWKFAA